MHVDIHMHIYLNPDRLNTQIRELEASVLKLLCMHTTIYIYICLCVYMYISIYICMCIYIYINNDICIHVDINPDRTDPQVRELEASVCKLLYMHTHIYIDICLCVYMYICMYICMCI